MKLQKKKTKTNVSSKSFGKWITQGKATRLTANRNHTPDRNDTGWHLRRRMIQTEPRIDRNNCGLPPFYLRRDAPATESIPSSAARCVGNGGSIHGK